MTKNVKGGKKHKRGKGLSNEDQRELIFKEDSQAYAKVTKLLGGSRVDTIGFDGVERQCLIRGKMRKRIWINCGDIILISLREFQDGKGDIIHKYTTTEARNLLAYGELPENAKINNLNDVAFEESGDEDINFCDDDIDDI